MGYSELVVVVLVLVPFFAKYFKEDLVKSDHSNCSHQAQFTASPRLQVDKENAITERFFPVNKAFFLG